MLIHSVTISIENQLADQWLDWVRKEHIPALMKTGCFLNTHMHELLSPPPMDGTRTFNLQFMVENVVTYERFQQTYASAFAGAHQEKFSPNCVEFQSVLSRIS